jgi:hypothetical protein
MRALLSRPRAPTEVLQRSDCSSKRRVEVGADVLTVGHPGPVRRLQFQGTQPPRLALVDLMRRDIPVDWTEQRRALDFL